MSKNQILTKWHPLMDLNFHKMSDVTKLPELASYMFIIWPANIRCRVHEKSVKDFSVCEKTPSKKKESGLYKYLSLSTDKKAHGDTWMSILYASICGMPQFTLSRHKLFSSVC